MFERAAASPPPKDLDRIMEALDAAYARGDLFPKGRVARS